MIVNKLTQSVRIPYELAKGSASVRQQKADELVKSLYQNLTPLFKDDYTIKTYQELEQQVKNILPDKRFVVIVKDIAPEDSKWADAICETLFDKNRTIKAHSINMNGISQTVRAKHLPAFLHEFQHAADDMYHPKLLSRIQKIAKKGLDNKKYSDFFDNHYYGEEWIESKRDKKEVLKIIKHKTKKFLRGFNIQEKMDYIQDMRYTLQSEINAYKRQIEIAKDLKNKGFKIPEDNFDAFHEDGIYKEKIQLLTDLAMEYIKKERAKHAQRVKKG